jgi:hypothetical protein
MSLDKHTLRQETWTYDAWAQERKKAQLQEQGKKQEGDSLLTSKNVNGWALRMDVNQYGKMTLIAEKTLGLGTITVRLDTKEIAPLIKLMPIPYDIFTHEGKYVEVNDRKQRENPEFKKDDKEGDEYSRQWNGSSIVTPSDFFNQAVPSFEELLKQKTLDEFVPKIETELLKIKRPKAQTPENQR